MVTLDEMTRAIDMEIKASNIDGLSTFFDIFNKLNEHVNKKLQEENKVKRKALTDAAELEIATNFDPLLHPDDTKLDLETRRANIVENFTMIKQKMDVLMQQVQAIQLLIQNEHDVIRRIENGLEMGDVSVHKANIENFIQQYTPIQAQLEPLRFRLEAFEIVFDDVRDALRKKKSK